MASRRQEVTKVRLTVQEKQELAVLAAAAGMSIPRLLVESAKAAADGDTLVTRRAAAQELLHVRRLLANVASNVNQIAAAANSGAGVAVVQLDAEMALLRRLGERTLAAIGELVG